MRVRIADSSALQAASGPVPFLELAAKEIRRGKKLAARLLNGVGGERMFFTTEPPGTAIHLQKPLTEDEIARLPSGWIDIPAIDERGPCRPL